MCRRYDSLQHVSHMALGTIASPCEVLGSSHVFGPTTHKLIINNPATWCVNDYWGNCRSVKKQVLNDGLYLFLLGNTLSIRNRFMNANALMCVLRTLLRNNYIVCKECNAVDLVHMIEQQTSTMSLMKYVCLCAVYVNSLWLSDAIWRHRTGSTLEALVFCCPPRVCLSQLTEVWPATTILYL